MSEREHHKITEKFRAEIIAWNAFDKKTEISAYKGVPIYTNEFWTSKQRAGNSLHEISYRACFKPQLPNFFISRLTIPGDLVFDPFMGRGTSILEAALLGRRAIGNDINPISQMLVEPRISPPLLGEIRIRLDEIDVNRSVEIPREFEAFFHSETLIEICNLKNYFIEKEKFSGLDNIDKWIRMVAINRLTGHSKGFFSVYTLPPNQATTIERQLKINEKRKQIPEYRDTKLLIYKKSKSLLKDYVYSDKNDAMASFLQRDLANQSLGIEKEISLSVTSPPFLNIVNYKSDNWMRCWFVGINSDEISITQTSKIETWKDMIANTLREVSLITKIGGHFALEVGEVRNGSVNLDEAVVDVSAETPWTAEMIIVNEQNFTKTSNAWGVDNNQKGTNSNRIVLFSLN